MLLSPQNHKSWQSIYIKELLNSEWLKEECCSLVTHCGFVTQVQLQVVENTHPHQHKKKQARANQIIVVSIAKFWRKFGSKFVENMAGVSANSRI